MSALSPQKRRAAFTRTIGEQPMRQTRSMARISDATELPVVPRSIQQRNESIPTASSSAHRYESTGKANRGGEAELDSFDTDSPGVRVTAQMASPKKGRFDDFEFELEKSIGESPVRRKRLENRSIVGAPSGSVETALPRSRTSVQLNSTLSSRTLVSSRKENRPTEVAATPSSEVPAKSMGSERASKPLHRPSQTVCQDAEPELSSSVDPPKRSRIGVASRANPSEAAASARQHPQPLLSRSSTLRSDLIGTAERNPFIERNDIDSLAKLGEPRHSPIKRMTVKSEYILQSPDRPDRKPINLLDLKPSPGKAQRGIFRHDVQSDDEDDADGSQAEDRNRIKLSSRSAASERPDSDMRHEGVKPPAKVGSSADSNDRSSSVSSPLVIDVKQTLSVETSEALASLEASLAKLTAKVQRAPSSFVLARRQEGDDSKRVLGVDSRRPGFPSSKTQVFTIRDSSITYSSEATTSGLEQSTDVDVFKRPTSRASLLPKSRQSSIRPAASLSSSRSEAPSYGKSGTKEAKATSSASDVDGIDSSAAAAEEKRMADLKAARRRSMHSILSYGMPPPMIRKAAVQRDAVPLRQSSAGDTSTASIKENESAEERKAAKAARRRSLYTYNPTKREDTEAGDRSISNTSFGIVIGSSLNAAPETGGTSSATKSARFLRGLTVLVDVRDQDGEDASACWVEMLKNAGAKVMLRFGERKLTHIVYKSGRPSTLHSYRGLPDPKPLVVGISWVVKCLEEGRRVAEEPYIVEVGKEAIFTHRRRSSMAPKQAPPPTSSQGDLYKDRQREIEEARKKLLMHAPAVPSPLRRRVSSSVFDRSLLNVSEQDQPLSSIDSTKECAVRSGHARVAETPGHSQASDGFDSYDAELAKYNRRIDQVLNGTPTPVRA